MGVTTKSLYDTDFVEWTAHTAKLLREGRLEDVDLENLIEEIESLGRSDQDAVRSQLRRMLMHLVKQKIQPERSSKSWRRSIVSAQEHIETKLESSPSLKRHLESALEKTYQAAVRDALRETGIAAKRSQLPIAEHCPYTLNQLLTEDLNSLSRR